MSIPPKTEFFIFNMELNNVLVNLILRSTYNKTREFDSKLLEMSPDGLIKTLEYIKSDKCSKYEKLLLPSYVWIFFNHKSESVCKWITENLKIDNRDDFYYYFTEHILDYENWKYDLAKEWNKQSLTK